MHLNEMHNCSASAFLRLHSVVQLGNSFTARLPSTEASGFRFSSLRHERGAALHHNHFTPLPFSEQRSIRAHAKALLPDKPLLEDQGSLQRLVLFSRPQREMGITDVK